MSLVRSALAHQRIATTHAAWTILRAQNAPTILAILEQRFAGEQRQIPAPELFEQVTEDLAELRSEGFDLPRSAQEYVSDWRRTGILIRRPSTDTREETFELSPGALAAIQFRCQVSRCIHPHRTRPWQINRLLLPGLNPGGPMQGSPTLLFGSLASGPWLGDKMCHCA